jgi:anti-anti-sigma regulatory factor
MNVSAAHEVDTASLRPPALPDGRWSAEPTFGSSRQATAESVLRAVVELSTDHVVLRLCGSLCMANEDRLRHIFDGVLAAGVSPGFTVDLRGIEFIDSTGVHGLLSLRRRAIAAGMDPTFVSGPAADRLFGLLDLLDLFHADAADRWPSAGPAPHQP